MVMMVVMMMMMMMPDHNHLTTIGNQMEMAAGKFGSLGDWLRFFFGYKNIFHLTIMVKAVLVISS